jgi:hypothetical protein
MVQRLRANERTPRSTAQNEYLWGVVYPTLAEATGYSVNETHQICKELFIARRYRKIGGREVQIPASTTTLTKAQFSEYLERIFALCGELGCRVQTPEEAGYISNTGPIIKSPKNNGSRHVD